MLIAHHHWLLLLLEVASTVLNLLVHNKALLALLFQPLDLLSEVMATAIVREDCHGVMFGLRGEVSERNYVSADLGRCLRSDLFRKIG